MTRLNRRRLNHLIGHIPAGIVLTLKWLKEQGISTKLAWWYVHSNWLERIGEEAYKKVGDQVEWAGAVSALQTQLNLSLHVGAKTALQLLGQAHFIPMQGIKRIQLFTRPGVSIPQWLRNEEAWKVEFKIYKTALFNDEIMTGLVERTVDGVNLFISSPERAILEVLYLVPKEQPFDEVVSLAESLGQLRPLVVQSLLEQCKSIKVKRLFLHLAERFQHTWLTELNLKKIDLGHGKRVIGSGGHYDPKYQISVPRITEE